MSKILLLGGTGAMGVNLSRRLVECGYDVSVTSRHERLDTDGIHYILGNAKDKSFLEKTLGEVKPDAVVDFMSYGSAEFAERKDVLLNGTGQYVFTSSCRVFAGENVHTERSPRLLDVCADVEYLKTDEYALAKARSENMLRDSRRRNWTIVRPCITYAYPRLQLGCFEANAFLPRVTQGLPVPLPAEMMEKRTTMLYGDDVAEMIARLVLNEKALGEDFNTVTAENHTWGEIANIYANAIGLKTVPCTLEEYKMFCSPYQVQYGRMVHHCFDNAKVLAVTGMKQSDLTQLANQLPVELGKWKSRPEAIKIDILRNAKVDRVLGTRVHFVGWRNNLEYARIRHPLIGKAMRIVFAIKRRI